MMGAIKITSADKYFSLCVRERADNKCERCGTHPNKGGLHCSHYHGRSKKGVRYDPDNGTALCMGCHLYFTSHPAEHSRWQRLERLGPYRFEALQERAEDLGRGRDARRWIKAIAAHFRREHAKLLKQREAGESGWLEFEGFL